MQAFVTGASGFLGGSLVQMLCQQGNTVVGLVRSDNAAMRVKTLGGKPVRGDLEQPMMLYEAMQGCDVVFHTAATLGFGHNSMAQRRINVDGTRYLLEAAHKAGVRRFVTISAASVIADGKPVLDADESRSFPARFVGPYSLTKAEAERLVLMANSTEMATMAIRPPGIWGVGDANILPQIVRMVQHRQFVWFDHGRYPYTTCHVTNVCEGAILAAERGQGGQAYFVTDGPPLLFREFVLGLLKTQGLTVGERSIPWRLALSIGDITEKAWQLMRRPGTPALSRETVALIGPFAVNDSKARHELGYQGLTTREVGLEALAASQKNLIA